MLGGGWQSPPPVKTAGHPDPAAKQNAAQVQSRKLLKHPARHTQRFNFMYQPDGVTAQYFWSCELDESVLYCMCRFRRSSGWQGGCVHLVRRLVFLHHNAVSGILFRINGDR